MGRWVDQSVGPWVGRSVGRTAGLTIGLSVGCWFGRWVGESVGWEKVHWGKPKLENILFEARPLEAYRPRATYHSNLHLRQTLISAKPHGGSGWFAPAGEGVKLSQSFPINTYHRNVHL